MFELVNAETILIGHSLESDLKAMRLVHKNCVDTSVVFPHKMGPPHKKALKTLASDILKKIIQENGQLLIILFIPHANCTRLTPCCF